MEEGSNKIITEFKGMQPLIVCSYKCTAVEVSIPVGVSYLKLRI